MESDDEILDKKVEIQEKVSNKWGRQKRDYYKKKEQSDSDEEAEHEQVEEIIQENANKLQDKELFGLDDNENELSEEEDNENLENVQDSELSDVKQLVKELKLISKELKKLVFVKNKAYDLKKRVLKSLALNILTYLLGKGEGEIMRDHPVIKKIAMLKLFSNKIDETINENEDILEGLNDIESENVEAEDYFEKVKAEKANKKISIRNFKANQKTKFYNSLSLKEYGDDDPRKINSRIMKNRGYVLPKKKVISRIKHKKKYQKAIYQLKSKGQFVRDYQNSYKGESTGIKAGIIKGVKLH